MAPLPDDPDDPSGGPPEAEQETGSRTPRRRASTTRKRTTTRRATTRKTPASKASTGKTSPQKPRTRRRAAAKPAGEQPTDATKLEQKPDPDSSTQSGNAGADGQQAGTGEDAGKKPSNRRTATSRTRRPAKRTAKPRRASKSTANKAPATKSAPGRRKRVTKSQRTSASPNLTVDDALRAGLWAPPREDAGVDDTGIIAGTAEAAPNLEASTAAVVLDKGESVGQLRTRVRRQRQQIRQRLRWLDLPGRALGALFDGLARVRVVALMCVALVAVAAFVPGIATIPPIDRAESRFAQASRQMVATADYVDIRVQEQVRYSKPVGIYWLQAAALHLTGQAQAADSQASDAPPVWVYRSASLVAGLAAALLVYWLALSFGPRPIAFAAALLFACTILVAVEARLAKTDAALLLLTVVAQAVLAKAFISKRDSAVRAWHAALFWTAIAGGILIMGPVLPMIVVFTGVAASLADRRFIWVRRLRPGYGILWTALLTVPWFVAIALTSGGTFFDVAVGRELAEVFSARGDGPDLFPGLITFVSLPTLGWPIGPLALLALPFALRTWKDRGTRFLFAWIVPSLIVMELTVDKLPQYALPLYPALAVLAARMVAYEKVPSGFWAGLVKLGFFVLPVTVAFGMPLMLSEWRDPLVPAGLALGVGAILLALFSWLFLLGRHARAAAVTTVACALLLFGASFGSHIPSARTLWITPQLTTALDAVVCSNPDLATLGYREPSLILMTQTDLVIETEIERMADFLSGEECRAGFVAEPDVAGVLEAIEARGGAVRAVARVEGIVLNGWDEIAIQVLTNDAGAAQLR